MNRKDSPTPKRAPRTPRKPRKPRKPRTPRTRTPSSLRPHPSSLTPSPSAFAESTLALPLYPWQRDLLDSFSTPAAITKAALCTPNGAGKSERIVATLALWWLAAHPRGKVVITTKDSKQLDNQVFPAIRRHEGTFHDWKFVSRLITTPAGGRCVLFTTDEPGRAEGWHKEDDTLGPLLIIVDEAKSVPDLIFQAIDRCTYNALLYVSSPGVKTGRFYNVFAKPAGFLTRQVGLKDCPHIPPARIDDITRTYGPDHPFTLSTLHGEFMDEDGETIFVIPPSTVRQLAESPPDFATGRQYAFCDFAAGGDENVLAHRIGNKILPLLAWKDANTMATIGRFIIEFEKRGLRPGDIYGDEGGLGGPIIDRLAEAGWPINRVNNAASPMNPARYENRGAELWHTAATLIAAAGIILPPDERLHTQLTTRKIKFLSDGRLGIEPKKDMAARGLASPDRADAVVGVIAIDTELAAGEFDPEGLARLETHVTPCKTGALRPADFGVHFDPASDPASTPAAWLQLWEEPTIGRAYLAVLKAGPPPARDSAVFIIRRADPTPPETKSSLHHPSRPPAGPSLSLSLSTSALVCRIHPEAPRTWDTALLADRIALLLRWYGNPVIIPDTRHALDLLDHLRERGATIHRRPAYTSAGPLHGGNATSPLGWETTEKNLPIPIAALARAIREATIHIPDETTLRAIRRFTRRPGITNNGPHATGSGSGLDACDPIALGIALHCLDAATVYTAPPIPHRLWNMTMPTTITTSPLATARACR